MFGKAIACRHYWSGMNDESITEGYCLGILERNIGYEEGPCGISIYDKFRVRGPGDNFLLITPRRRQALMFCCERHTEMMEELRHVPITPLVDGEALLPRPPAA